jgi:hypothetical protein
MCNLYSVTKGQKAIIGLVKAMRDLTGKMPRCPRSSQVGARRLSATRQMVSAS